MTDINRLLEDSNKGDIEAIYILGMHYLQGISVSRNLPEAIRCLEKVASKHALAAYNLAAIYETMFNKNKDQQSLQEAFQKYYLIAAKLGNADAKQKMKTLGVKRILKQSYPAIIPLSYAQQRLWILDKLLSNKAVYNMPIAIRLNGKLKIEALQSALNHLLKRHEVLRTCIKEIAGEAQQEIKEELEFPLMKYDMRGELAGLTDLEKIEKIRSQELKEAELVFDLSRAPLIRGRLLIIDEHDYLLLITIHHIASDGWSLKILTRDISQLYNHYAFGEDINLIELSIQYADYTLWQHEYLQHERLTEQLSYWQEELKGAPSILDLPTDKQRPKDRSYQGRSFSIKLSQELSLQLQQLSQQEGCTLFVSLLASLYVLLWRYSGQEDIVIGSPIANRTQHETAELIGFFANTLALRGKIVAERAFKEFLATIKEHVLNAQSYQDVPFEHLVEHLQVERDLSHSPLFQVMFVLQSDPDPTFNLTQLAVEAYAGANQQAKFDLTFIVQPGINNELEISIHYANDLYEEPTIKRLGQHWQILLERIVKNPKVILRELSLVTDKEQKLLLTDWNQTAVDYPKDSLIHQLFEAQVINTPDNIAVISGDNKITYRELNEQANQLASYLRKQDIKNEELVGIYLERSIEFISAMLAVSKVGGAFIPISTAYPPERIRYILADSQMKGLISKTNLSEGLEVKIYALDKINLANEAKVNTCNTVKPTNLAYAIYTSGSTGKPKAALIEHRNLVNTILAHQQYFKLTPHDRYSQFADAGFDAAICEIFPPLITGASVYIINDEIRLDLEKLNTYYNQNGITSSFIPPALFESFAKLQNKSLRFVIVAGDKLNNFIPQHYEVYNCYGPTECTVWTTAKKLEVNKPITIGKPVANNKIYILDKYFQPVPIGVSGELYIGGSSVARGYLNQPELTQERFIANPFATEEDKVKGENQRLYKTGDLVRYLSDGNIEYLGRTDFQVKIRGFRIETGEIESLIRLQNDIQDVAVIASDNVNGDKRLVAYLVLKNGIPDPLEQRKIIVNLKKRLQENLPDYMIPSAYMFLMQLPLNNNGKLDRNKLPAPDFIDLQEYVAPGTETERIVVNICAEILGVNNEKISILANFFELGGHSLLATRLAGQLSQKFEINFEVKDVFELSTIQNIAELVLTKLEEGSSPLEGISAKPRPDNIPLSFAQQRLWFMQQIVDDPATYNIPVILRLKGKLNIAALENAFKAIIDRHESLRTIFLSVSGEPSQVILSSLSFALNYTDLTSILDTERIEKYNVLVQDELKQPFDLSKGPLIRSQLIKLAIDEYALFVTMHHIIADGWSAGIIIKELNAYYNSYKKARNPQIPSLSLQYADFALWQHTYLENRVISVQKDFWIKKLKDAPHMLSLPTDYPRPAVLSNTGGRQQFELSADLVYRLQHLPGVSAKASLFMRLLTIFNILLYRYTGQNDFLIGTRIANRHYSELEHLIGFFANTLALRCQIDEKISFIELLNHTTEQILQTYANQDFPFERLVEELKVERSLSYSPLVQVVFILQNNQLPEFNLNELSVEIEQIKTEEGLAKTDLTVSLMPKSDGRIIGTVQYAKDLFKAETVERLVHHWLQLIHSTIANPMEKVSKLSLLSSNDYKQMIEVWNPKTIIIPENTIVSVWEEQVKKTPHKTAIYFQEQIISYKELNEKSNQLAHYLKTTHNLNENDIIGIAYSRSIDMVIAILAVLKTGSAYLALDLTYPIERLKAMVADSGIKLVLNAGQITLTDTVTDINTNILAENIAAQPHTDLKQTITSQFVAYLIYTSGSTGKPKAVKIAHANVLNYIPALSEKMQLTLHDIYAHTASFSFSSSVRQLWLPLLNGASIALTNDEQRRDPKALIALTKALKITIWDIVPSYWQNILQTLEATEEIASLRVIAAASEALAWPLVNEWHHKLPHISLINMYGQTETAGIVCSYPITPLIKDTGIVPIGRPLANTQAYVLDEHLQPLPVGVVGDLFIGGASVGLGYHQLPDLTQERFISHPFNTQPTERLYKTGDKVRILADGTLEYVGRTDFQVKLRGYRIELGEIEAAIRTQPEVKEVVVSAYTVQGEQRLVAYIVSNTSISNEEQQIKAIRQYLQGLLPNYMLPSSYVFLETLPLTVSGKLDKNALPKPTWSMQTIHYIPPVTGTEKITVKICAEILKLDSDKISIAANFFELGGHSLLATRYAASLQKACDVEISVQDIFQYPTLEQLAELVDNRKAQGSVASKGIIAQLRPDRIPLSFAQQRLWFLDKLLENKAAYNMPVALRLKGQLNHTALQQALDALLVRHEILRTHILEIDGIAYQAIENELSFPLEISKALEAEVETIATIEAKAPFDLNQAPLVRGKLIEIDNENYVLLLTLHHIVSDGWSMSIMARDISHLYNHYAYGIVIDLPVLSIQYVDYAMWQREHLSGEHLEKELNYWKEQLCNAPSILEMPTDKARPKNLSYIGDNYRFHLPKSITQQLAIINNQHGTSLFMSLLTSLYILLYRYSGQEDIVIGTSIANRTTQETEQLIGFFVNALALRASINPQHSYIELLQKVKQTALGAYRHQDIPFEYLVDALAIERDLSRSPLFQVMLVLQNNQRAVLNLNKIDAIPFGQEFHQAKFDLTFTVTELATGELAVSIQYATDLYEADTIKRLATHWEILLHGIVKQSFMPIEQLPLLTELEKQILLYDWNSVDTIYPYNTTIHDIFEKQVAKTPNNIAVIFEETQLTYQKLNEQANQLAHHLLALGVKPDTLIAISLDRSLNLMIGILGILKAGGAYVPLDPSYPADRLQFMLDDAKAPIVITQQSYREQFKGYTGHILCLDETIIKDIIAKQPTFQPVIDISPSHLAYVIYTSGSTGKPKGVLIEHYNVCRLFSATQHWYQFSENDIWTLFHSYAFDFSVWEMWGALFHGGRLVIVPYLTSRSPESFYELLFKQQVTVLNQTPSAFQQLIAHESTLQNVPKLALRYVIFGGEALEISSLLPWLKRHGDKIPQLINMYGITETTVHVTYQPIDKVLANANQGSLIGRQIPDLSLYILDHARQPVPIGITGELYIGGSGVARGYLNRLELTQERFIDNPFVSEKDKLLQRNLRLYKTGDLARYLSNGNIEYRGRSDFQVKIRGFRIELGEIESLLRQQEDIQDVAVLAREDEPGHKHLVAYLVAVDDLPEQNKQIAMINQLRERLQQHLPDYMVPTAFMYLKQLPINSNGKLDRKALPKPEFIQIAEYIAPSNEKEQLLVELWSTLLRIPMEKISATDNFFQLGGDSIISIQLVSRVRAKGWQLTVQEIFSQKTLGDLARVMQQEEKYINQEHIQGEVPLLAIQQWFFEQALPKPYHYNQAVLLQPKVHLRAEDLENILKQLVQHHDQLRACYKEHAGIWQQIIASELHYSLLKVIDLQNVTERTAAITKACNDLQASFNLTEGPLFKALLMELGDEQRLFLVAHHLVIDGVSWRIILEDIERLLQYQILPPKTHSYRDWAKALMKLNITEQERAYWLSQLGRGALPTDRLADKICEYNQLTLSLSKEQTQHLLQLAPRAYQTQINDLLLAALAISMSEWSGQAGISFWLENHGRLTAEDDALKSFDLSRTVGWFTSLFPVFLKVDKTVSVKEQLQFIKESLRNIPLQGIGYGVLAQQGCFVGNTSPQIIFNYLGQFDNVLQHDSFSIANESSGCNLAKENQNKNLWSIKGSIYQGQLQLHWDYSANHYELATAERIVAQYQQTLLQLIQHCAAQEIIHYTPSDFPLAKLNQSQLDYLLTLIRKVQPATEVEDIYPLSPLQAGLLFQHLLAPDSQNYMVQIVFEFTELTNIEGFKLAWEAVIEHQPMLRTGFLSEGLAEPVQYVLKHVTLPWIELDWQALPAREREAALTEQLQVERKKGFDLTQAPLLRLHMIKLQKDHYYLILTNHHILLDGWSMPILYGQVLQAYQQYVAGKIIHLSHKIPYRDYIAWLTRQDIDKAKIYWSKRLNGLSEPSLITYQLPFEREVNETIIEELKYSFSAEQTKVISMYAQQHKITLNTLLQSAVVILLAHYLQQEDVVIGVTVSGRDTGLFEQDKMVGLFINTLPLRTIVKGPLSALWAQIQSHMQELSRYGYMQLAEVQRLSGYTQGLFDVLYVLENYPLDEAVSKSALTTLTATVKKSIEQTEYPLSIRCMPGEQLVIKFNYRPAKIATWVAQGMLENLQIIFKSILSDTSQQVKDIPILATTELKKLLVEWNKTQTIYPVDKTIKSLFEEQVAHTPNNIAVVFGDKQLTYHELNEHANQLAHFLSLQGVGKEVLVGVHLERSHEYIIALLAIIKAGGAFVPISTAYPVDRINFIIMDSQVAGVITTSEYTKGITQPTSIYELDKINLSTQSKANLVSDIAPHNIVYAIYTSGSTGKPKAALIEHRNLVNLTNAYQQYFKLSEHDRCSQFADAGFDAAIFEIFPPLVTGASLFILNDDLKLDLEKLNTYYEQQHITGSFLPTALFETFATLNNTSLRYLVVAGDKLNTFIPQRYEVHNCYGPTECTVWTTAKQLDKDELITIGKPIANNSVYILDQHLKTVPIGVPGELYIGGDSVSRGYLNRPEINQERFIFNPYATEENKKQGRNIRLYKTGDLVRYLPDGNIEYIGRTDFQVKIRGFRIELGEIENVLRQQAQIQDVVVIAREDEPGDKRLVAYLILNDHIDREQESSLIDTLKDNIKHTLPDYMVPSAFMLLKQWPLNANGKLDRKELPKPDYRSRQKRSLSASEIEKELLKIWAEILHVDTIDVTDNFFDLGGHSLLIPQLSHFIYKRLGLRVNMESLIEHPTIQQMVLFLKDESEAALNEPLVAIQPLGKRLPIFCIHPAGGTIMCYIGLSKLLGKDQPIYGIQQIEGTKKKGIEERASVYIEAIRRKQPHGPYLLLGYSLGGLIAHEIAYQLEQAGEQVQNVILIDSTTPQQIVVSNKNTEAKVIISYIKRLSETYGQKIDLDVEEFESLSSEEKKLFFYDKLKQMPTDAEALFKIAEEIKESVNATVGYNAKVINAPIISFQAKHTYDDLPVDKKYRQEIFNTWQKSTTNKVKAYQLPGNHHQTFIEPALSLLASILQQHLR